MTEANKQSYDVIIIGAGASGLFCASIAGQRGLKVLVLEHNKAPGKKILISGGGRCNFTNLNSNHEDFRSENKHFCKSSLAQYTPADFLKLVEDHGIPWVEKAKGQLFCQDSAKSIVKLLIDECDKGKVEIRYGVKVESVNLSHDTLNESGFHLTTNKGEFLASQLVIASGGLSLKEIGASDFGHQVAKQFGHEVTTTLPALVPIYLEKENGPLTELSGVSLPVKVQYQKNVLEEDLLFTRKGLSGPAILKISLYFPESVDQHPLVVDFLPTWDMENALFSQSDKTLGQLLKGKLPKRFIDTFAQLQSFELNKKLGEISKKERQKIVNSFKKFEIIVKKTEGYRKAEVTVGGVSCKKVDSKTMESRLQKGLFFVGEVLDVTGQLGGHNFQWAWSSGYACGQSLETGVES